MADPAAAERERLTWQELGDGTRALAEMVHASGYAPDMVLAIARGGLLVAGALGYALGVKNVFTVNVEFYTGLGRAPRAARSCCRRCRIRASSRERRVLICDDVADTGETLALVQRFCERHVAEARTAVLYEKPRSVVRCDYVWRRTDRWITFAWSAHAAGRQPTPPRTRAETFGLTPAGAAGKSAIAASARSRSSSGIA